MSIVPVTEATLLEAARLIAAGQLVAFATETVYGLGADATDGLAVARIFAAKGRPSFNPLISHFATVEAASGHAVFDDLAERLAQEFWPGPMTLVLPRRALSTISELATAGLATVAIRIPDHPIARRLLSLTDRPVAAPSANRSGHVSATTAAHVAADLGDRVAMILDGGPTAHGLESTVLSVAGDQVTLLRPGAITSARIEAVLGTRILRSLHGGAAPTAPGQLESHYAPRAGVRLDATWVATGEALLAFGPDPLPTDGPTINLSPAGDTIEAAAGLFAALRKLDTLDVQTIAVMTIPDIELGEAINDRLRRAAARR